MSNLAKIVDGLVKEDKKPLKKLATTAEVGALETSSNVMLTPGGDETSERRLSCVPLETISENDASWSRASKPASATYAVFYFKLMRSGSLAVPAGEYTDEQKAGKYTSLDLRNVLKAFHFMLAFLQSFWSCLTCTT